MRAIIALSALAALSACSDWSMDEPTAEQIAIARYLCADDTGALDAYLATRGDIVAALPSVGPERALYCAARGNRIAGLAE